MAFGVSLDKGQTWTEASDSQEIWTGFHDAGGWQISMKYGGTGSSGGTTAPTPTGLDKWGIKMIYPTAASGRVWNAPLDTGSTRTLRSGQRDGTNELCPLGNATYTITPSAGELKMAGDAPRAYVYDAQRIKMFENVEITCYYKSVATTSAIATGYQGFELSCRGQHELQRGNDVVRTYYSRHSLNGTWWRLKEDTHPKSYDVSIRTGVTFNKGTWYGMKFVVRNMANGNVKLESYRDTTDGANGGNWEKMSEFTDSNGAWSGLPVYNSKNSGCHSHFARTDNASDFRIKKWSIREIAPLQ